MTVLIWALIGYAAGCFPSAWLVALATGKRVILSSVRRNYGEADAHVVLSQTGGRGAHVAAALDVLKALLPVVIAARMTSSSAVAACAVGTVTGHCWPPLLFRYGGRGLTAAAGAFLGFVPVEMVIAGIVRLIGGACKAGGLTSTIGFIAVPLLAAWRGQPRPFIVAAAAINLLIFVRRLEGVAEDISLGIPRSRAVFRRVVFDSSSGAPRSFR